MKHRHHWKPLVSVTAASGFAHLFEVLATLGVELTHPGYVAYECQGCDQVKIVDYCGEQYGSGIVSRENADRWLHTESVLA